MGTILNDSLMHVTYVVLSTILMTEKENAKDCSVLYSCATEEGPFGAETFAFW